MVDPTTRHDVEKLSQALPLGIRIRKCVGHTHAVDGILRDAVHHLRRINFRQFVNRRNDIDDVVKL